MDKECGQSDTWATATLIKHLDVCSCAYVFMFLCGWFMIDRKRREVEKKASGGAKVYNGVNVVGGLVDEEEKMVTT